MNHDELLTRINNRLDKIEEKLDVNLERVSKLETNLSWVKGSLKTTLAFVLSLTIGLVTTFLRTLKG